MRAIQLLTIDYKSLRSAEVEVVGERVGEFGKFWFRHNVVSSGISHGGLFNPGHVSSSWFVVIMFGNGMESVLEFLLVD